MSRQQAKRIRFSTWAERYEREQIELLRVSSAESFASFLRAHLVPAFGERWLHEIDLAAMQSLVATLAAQGLHRTTIKSIINLGRRMLARARLQGFEAQDIRSCDVTLPKVARVKPERRCLTPAESAAIIAAAPAPWNTFFEILASFGLRGGEALGLQWNHVDLDRRLLYIRQAATHGRIEQLKSHNSIADLAIPDALAKRLAAYHKRWTPNARGLLFATARGAPHWASTVRRVHFTPLLRRLGLARAAFHAFRHGCAVAMLDAGIAITVVQKTLRHGSIQMTMTYTHVSSEDRKNAIASMARALERASRNRPKKAK
jgi:integrase